jgi:hypothetical protein
VDADSIIGYKPKQKQEPSNEINMNAMQAHLNNLKLFNYTRAQDNLSENNNHTYASEINSNGSNELSVSNLLKENSAFLENIGKKY